MNTFNFYCLLGLLKDFAVCIKNYSFYQHINSMVSGTFIVA